MAVEKRGMSDFESGSPQVIGGIARQQQVERELRGETLTEAERKTVASQAQAPRQKRRGRDQINRCSLPGGDIHKDSIFARPPYGVGLTTPVAAAALLDALDASDYKLFDEYIADLPEELQVRLVKLRAFLDVGRGYGLWDGSTIP